MLDPNKRQTAKKCLDLAFFADATTQEQSLLPPLVVDQILLRGKEQKVGVSDSSKVVMGMTFMMVSILFVVFVSIY